MMFVFNFPTYSDGRVPSKHPFANKSSRPASHRFSFTGQRFTTSVYGAAIRPARSALATLALWFTTSVGSIAIGDQAVQFDLPAVSAATVIASQSATTPDSQANPLRTTPVQTEKLVTIDFQLSTILAELQAPQIEQLVVQIKPLGGYSLIADYSPRTEFSSHYATDIAVCESNESSDHVGLGIQGSYHDLARGNIGADKGHKQAQESKYAKVAPQHVVAASGTTHRGHGVYFKLKADARQVIDGDRTFSVTLRVPTQWRGELIEFRVQAEAMSQPSHSAFAVITGTAPKREQLGAGRFLVAAYLETDAPAALAARQLAKAEQALREMATEWMRQEHRSFPVPKDVYVAFRLDQLKGNEPLATEKVLEIVDRVLFSKVDPYFDTQIKKLPVDARVAILDYLEARQQFDKACEE